MKELISYIMEECLKKGATFSEVRIVHYTRVESFFNNGRKDWVSHNKILEIFLKVWKSGVTSSGYTTSSDRNSLDDLIESTLDNIQVIKGFANNQGDGKPVSRKIAENVLLKDIAYEDVPLKTKLKFIKALQTGIREVSAEIKTSMMYSDRYGFFYFGNSDGYYVYDRISEFLLETSMELVYALKRMNRTFVHAGRLSEGSFDLKIANNLGKTRAKRFINSLLVPLPPKKKMNVVMDGELAGRIIHELVHGLEGDLLLSGRSPWKKKRGKQIFSSKLTVIDDPQYDLSRRTLEFNFDANGFQRKKTTIVDNGVLKSFLTDITTSASLKVDHTCSARATDDNTYTFAVSTNIIIKKGEKSLKELVQEAEDGVLCQGALEVDIDWKNQIIRIVPEQAMFIANGILNDDIVVSVEINYPVDDLMKRLIALGDKTKIAFTKCTKGGGILCCHVCPPMLFGRLTVKV